MRQAGRILKPYRELKERSGSIVKLFKEPELAAQITLMPVELLGVDAAILFADILTPIEPMGCSIDFAPGPVFANPIRTARDIDALDTIESDEQLPFVMETIRLIRNRLPDGVPLIGFGGSPITLATYMVEGGSAKSFTMFRRLLHTDPVATRKLLGKLTTVVVDYLEAQVRSGVQAVQLFDTWVGQLSVSAFLELAKPSLQQIFSALKALNVPRIYFAQDASHLLPHMADVGADLLSVDWRVDLAHTFDMFERRIPLQGNLDPTVLHAGPEVIVREAERILEQTNGMPHIFNLGHGVLPDTPIENVQLLIDTVHGSQ